MEIPMNLHFPLLLGGGHTQITYLEAVHFMHEDPCAKKKHEWTSLSAQSG